MINFPSYFILFIYLLTVELNIQGQEIITFDVNLLLRSNMNIQWQ